MYTYTTHLTVTWTFLSHRMDTYITVMLLFYFQKRIRSSDLVKSARCFGESKYDFSKIIKLKGATGRDVSKKGRPEGITSTASHVQETSSTSMIVANEDAVGSYVDIDKKMWYECQ